MTSGVYLARRAGFSHADCKRLLDRLSAGFEQPLAPDARTAVVTDDLFAAIRQVSPRLGEQVLRVLDHPSEVDSRARSSAMAATRRYAERAWQRATPFAGLAGIAVRPDARREDARATVFESGASRVARVFAEADVLDDESWVVRNGAVVRQGPDLLVPELVLQDRSSAPRSSRTRATRPIAALLAACQRPVRLRAVLDEVASELAVPHERLRPVVSHLVRAQLLFALRERVTLEQIVAPPPLRVTDRSGGLEHGIDDAQSFLSDLPARFPGPDTVRRVERVLRKVASRGSVRRDGSADRYAMAFLDRFGIGARVPLLRVVDRSYGIGFTGTETTEDVQTPADPAKRSVLERLVRRAAARDLQTVELDRDELDELLGHERRPFREFDAVYELDGDDPSNAWLTRIGRTSLAGATAGRFHRALPASVFSRAQDGQTAHDSAVKPATAWFLPRWATSLDVMDMPSPVPLRIEVDFRSGDEGTVGLDDLDVMHDGERLVLLDRTDDRPIVIRNHSMFNVGQLTSPMVRTLLALGRESLTEWLVFDWGPLDGWDFLPGIVHDGVGLSRPLWRLPAAMLDRSRPEHERAEAFHRWRADRGVRGHLEFGDGDQTLTVDVAAPDAWSLISGTLTPDNPLAFGAVAWTDDDPATEYVQRVGASARTERPTAEHPRRSVVVADTGPALDWLSLELALGVGLPETRHWADLLRVAAGHGVDEWHFLYFNDPDEHLRLRFRAPDPAARGALRADLEAVAFGLARRTFRRVNFTPYFPEWERYGGPANMQTIWRLFTESSEAVLGASSGRRELGEADYLAGTAAVAVDQVRALVGNQWRTHIDEGLAHIRADRRSHHRRAEALRSLRGRCDRETESVSGAFAEGVGVAPVRGVINSVLHMHSNRAFPGDHDEEMVLLTTVRAFARLPEERS